MTSRPRSRALAPLLPACALVLLAACGDAPPAEDEATPGTDTTTAVAAPDSVTPGPDIWLADLIWTNGFPSVANLRQGTTWPGYDNQPHFFPDGAIRFTRQDGVRTDIWRLDPATGEATPVTRTDPESEYSPTATPDGTGFTAIVVEADSTQRLWRFDLDGTPVGPVFEDLAPVGYHAWVDDATIAMFVLGDPATLQVGTVGEPGATEIVAGIGRSLNAVPDADAVTFPRVFEDGRSEIWWYEGGEIRRIAAARPGSQDHVWARGLILQAEDTRLYALDPRNPESGWTLVADLADQGISVTRMAVSAGGGTIAVVAEPR